ncbi:hypothetical protein H6768_05015 [Candidatus Peribacteria bacterium]|nr:hypothetical protein [Candidatus Peribacteria bacterium]
MKRILLKDFQLRIEIDEKYLEESRIKYAKAPAGLDEPREAVKSAEESLEWHKYQLQILESCTSFEALKEVCSSKLKIIYFKEVKEEIDRYLLLKRIDKVTERVGGIL